MKLNIHIDHNLLMELNIKQLKIFIIPMVLTQSKIVMGKYLNVKNYFWQPNIFIFKFFLPFFFRIRFVFQQIGQIGSFNAVSLLTNLVAALALFVSLLIFPSLHMIQIK